jgi:two-component system sensor histidine kinase BaeS
MAIGIRSKLIIAFTAVALLVTFIAFMGIFFTFRSGFIGYVNEVRSAKLKEVHTSLSEYLQTKAEWESLTENRRLWTQFLRQNDRRGSSEHFDHRDVFPHHPGPRSEQPPHLRDQPPIPPPKKSQLILVDDKKTAIYGRFRPTDTLLLEPLYIRGDLVGYVGLEKLRNLRENRDKVFVHKQTRYFIVVVIIACIIAVFFAFVIARWMTAPLQKLSSAMSQLMQRDYSVTMEYKASDEIGSLVQAFNQLTKSLSDYETSQQQWITDISHELRTPVSTLKGEIEALQDGVRPLTPEHIDSLYEELIRLQKLVEDLHQLSLTDLGAMRYQFASVRIKSLLQELMESHHRQLKGFEYSISGSQDFVVYADEDRLYQLFRNLLQNTVRYTNTPGEIKISMRSLENYMLEIKWEDSAPSVERQSLGKLFDRLYREEKSRNRQQGGSGLGLSICKSIVDAHKGSIEAEHSALGGLAVVIKLPVAQG